MADTENTRAPAGGSELLKLIDAAKALQHAAEHATPEVAAVYKARAAEVFGIVSALASAPASAPLLTDALRFARPLVEEAATRYYDGTVGTATRDKARRALAVIDAALARECRGTPAAGEPPEAMLPMATARIENGYIKMTWHTIPAAGITRLYAAAGHSERYEFVRQLSPQAFAELHAANIRGEGAFDALVDAAIAAQRRLD